MSVNVDNNIKWDAIIDKLEKAVENAIGETVGQTFKEIVDRTPVGRPELWDGPEPFDYVPGTLRKSWEIDTGNGFNKPIQNFGSKLDVKTALMGYKFGNEITIKNDQPYAARIEFQGWSRQAPAGMVRISLKTLKTNLERAVNKNKIK